MSEPATDLAVVCAIASSYYEQPIGRDVAMIGEVRAGWAGHALTRGRRKGERLRPVEQQPVGTWPHMGERALGGRKSAGRGLGGSCCSSGGGPSPHGCESTAQLPLSPRHSPACAPSRRPQVGLGGELRPVGNIERRVMEALKVGRGRRGRRQACRRLRRAAALPRGLDRCPLPPACPPPTHRS